MLRINRQTDYAIRVLLALAGEPPGKRLPSARIGRRMLIPPALLARVVARLARAGLVNAYPGRDGGLTLGRPAAAISLGEVVELFEGPLLLSECMQGKQDCPFENACPVRGRWNRLQQVILAELVGTDFAQLAAEAPAPAARSAAGSV
jgi:Rrf2 family protein